MAQAKTLADSVKATNPDYTFFIGLTDSLNSEIDYPNEIGHTIIAADQIGIPEFDSLWKKYSIVEFNTNVKPFYFEYFTNQYPELDYLFYLDPDTFVYNNFDIIEQEFGKQGEVLLTPHIITPIPIDDKVPGENLFLNFGIYNLGFFGMKNPQHGNKVIDWWKERTYELGFCAPADGFFVDQLWHNLTPIFFENAVVSKHPGLNMGPWNFHERRVSKVADSYLVNNQFPLSFFHFSNYKYTSPNTITGTVFYNRYNFETNPDVVELYSHYHNLLISNGVEKLSKIKCNFMEMKVDFIRKEVYAKINKSPIALGKHYINSAFNIISAMFAKRKN